MQTYENVNCIKRIKDKCKEKAKGSKIVEYGTLYQ